MDLARRRLAVEAEGLAPREERVRDDAEYFGLEPLVRALEPPEPAAPPVARSTIALGAAR